MQYLGNLANKLLARLALGCGIFNIVTHYGMVQRPKQDTDWLMCHRAEAGEEGVTGRDGLREGYIK